MKHLAARGLALSLTLGLLQACQPKPDALPVTAPAPASAPAGALDDSPTALMQAAFDGWTAKAPYPVEVPSGDAGKAQQVEVLATPALVIALDADYRVLVVNGVPTDSGGQPDQSHAAAANVALYGFERRDGRWVKTLERPSLTWTGFNGDAGRLKAHPLGPGRAALSVENGSCWQGFCGSWLQVYALSVGGVRLVTSQRVGSESTGATVGCEEWLKGEPLDVKDGNPAITPDNCFTVESHWRFESSDGPGWPDLLLSFKGRAAVEDAKAGSPSVQVIDEELVLRDDGASYKPLRGSNPTRDF